MDLGKLRSEIDKVDTELIRLLNRRMEMVLRTKKFKAQIEIPEREKEVLDKVREKSLVLIRQNFSERLFSDIITESKNLQAENLKLIGFQGEHGAHSEVATRKYDPIAVPIPYLEFVDVFEGVKTGQLDLGVVPVMNSMAGPISKVDDSLIQYDLNIIAEIELPIHHCLLALPGTDYRDIKVVYSHSQALTQCRGFISRTKLDPRPYYDTAGAAMMLARDRPTSTSVIANELCANLYSLDIIKEKIEDYQHNFTRFIVISKEENTEVGNKGSIAFTTSHKAGALFNVLRLFSDADINLTKIQSRPILEDPGNFAFILDFQGSTKDSKINDVLSKVENETVIYKFLGCYKEVKI